MHTTWTGKRVRIRPWRSGDELYAFSKRTNIRPNEILGPRWYPLPKENQLFEPAGLMDPQRICLFAIERLETEELLGLEGTVFLRGTGLVADIGTFIIEEHRGQGFGCEAKLLAQCFLFESFALERVDAWTFASHAKARRGLELCGMHYEGRSRRCQFSQGRYVDRVHYVIFREEWEKLPVRGYVQRG
jgi:ribosomal-protein-alanine N-acetyltransferase